MFDNEGGATMEPTLKDFPLQPGDRVVVFHDGKAHRARITDEAIMLDVMVDVTLVKGGDVLTFPREAVFPLYRYVEMHGKSAVVPLFMLKSGKGGA